MAEIYLATIVSMVSWRLSFSISSSTHFSSVTTWCELKANILISNIIIKNIKNKE